MLTVKMLLFAGAALIGLYIACGDTIKAWFAKRQSKLPDLADFRMDGLAQYVPLENPFGPSATLKREATQYLAARAAQAAKSEALAKEKTQIDADLERDKQSTVSALGAK